MAAGKDTPKDQEKEEPSTSAVRRGSKSIWPWKKETDGSASFLRAARAGNLDKVLEFLKTNTDINTCNANGLNALHLASKEGHTNVVSALIERNANVDSATKKGNTALHIASLAGQDEIVKVLVESGATVNIQSQNGFTPLYMAAQENHDSVVRFLLAHGANQSLATEDGFTPLAVALQQGHDRVVSVLLENDTRGKVRLPALHIAAKKDDAKAAALLLHTDHNPDITSKSGFTPLHIASHYGNDNIAALLIQRGADVNYVAKHQITPLHVASKWGKGNMVSLLLDKGANIEAKTRDGLTPLHCAARSGHETVVDMLLEKGAPITAKTKNGLAPLHMASQGDHVDAARILLYHKAPVDDVTVDFLTALHVAAHCGHVRVAKLLLDRKADPNARALNGFTPLHIACKKNRIKVVELLLKHGASIEATTESGLTPLHVASFMGCMNIVIYLIQHGASADVPTVRGESPLHLAARANQTDIIRILLRNGAEVDAKAREQQTALHIASRLGNTDIVGLLLQQGASVDAPTKDLYTPLHIAAKEGQEEVAGVLLDHGASLNTPTKKGFTPLHLAAKYGHMKVARLLLQREAPVDPKGKNGVTPLHVAAHYDHQNVAMLLLDKGAQPHATAKNGYTPLHIAARKNQMDIAGTLLEYGANANAESKAGFTPLHLSAQEGHKDMATLLLEHGAQAGGAAKNGLTPLHLCAQEDRVPVAAVLVKHGASVDAQTKAGYTPLHVASHFGQMNMVRFLLQHGTEVDASTQLGYTPLHQAAQQGHTQIVNLLLENKAQPNMETNDGKTALSIAQRLGYISVVETLKVVTETRVTTNTTTTTEEKYKVVVPETMHETFMSESEDEGADDTMLGDQSYRYLTVDEMKSLGDDSLPIDVTRDEKMDVSFQSNVLMSAPGEQHITPQHKKELLYSQNFPIDNVDVGKAPILAGPESLNTTMNTSYNPVEDESLIVNDESRTGVPDRETTQNSQFPATVTQKSEVSNIWDQFLVSFMVDARGGAMRGCRHSGVRVIIPPRKAAMPMRITCRYLKKDKLVHAPPLMEGEALASRILEMGPSGAKFLGPVIIEVPHFASLRGKEREIVILRSDNGETWREHTLEATEEAVQEVLNESFDGEELKQLEDLNTNRITRILTTDFPQYFAIVTRIRQEVHAIGPEGGMVSSTVVPQVQAVFPQGALTKKIKVGLQAQPISTDLVAKLLGNRVAVSPIVTVEPRRRKFHKPITLTIPVPQAASKGMINQYSGEAPTLRLLCSITGGTTRAQWEDVTGSTPLTFVNDCVSFTTTVSARFWLMDCTNIPEATKMATELYREAIHVPFMAKFVVFGKRHQMEEARVRVFCMTDDKEDKTLESQEHFIEVAKSRDVEVLEGKSQYLEFAGNLIPVTKSGDQLAFNFYAFRENRLPFTVRVKDQNSDPVGRVAFMRQPKVGRGDAPQNPICNLNLTLPDNIQPEPAPSEPDLLALEKKYAFLSISKADTIHKADLRLSDISNMLTGDWVALAKELEISDSDINIIKSQYPDNIPQQAIVMLRLWMQTAGNKATGNTLEKALRSIHRDDIVDECICNVEVVTDDSEKATAEEVIDRFEIAGVKADVVPEKTEPSPPGEICYEEKDMMKEAESADEEEISHKIRPDGFTQPSGEPSQMVHGDTAPLTDVKPSVTATELDASQTKPTEKVTAGSSENSAVEEISRTEDILTSSFDNYPTIEDSKLLISKPPTINGDGEEISPSGSSPSSQADSDKALSSSSANRPTTLEINSSSNETSSNEFKTNDDDDSCDKAGENETESEERRVESSENASAPSCQALEGSEDVLLRPDRPSRPTPSRSAAVLKVKVERRPVSSHSVKERSSSYSSVKETVQSGSQFSSGTGNPPSKSCKTTIEDEVSDLMAEVKEATSQIKREVRQLRESETPTPDTPTPLREFREFLCKEEEQELGRLPTITETGKETEEEGTSNAIPGEMECNQSLTFKTISTGSTLMGDGQSRLSNDHSPVKPFPNASLRGFANTCRLNGSQVEEPLVDKVDSLSLSPKFKWYSLINKAKRSKPPDHNGLVNSSYETGNTDCNNTDISSSLISTNDLLESSGNVCVYCTKDYMLNEVYNDLGNIISIVESGVRFSKAINIDKVIDNLDVLKSKIGTIFKSSSVRVNDDSIKLVSQSDKVDTFILNNDCKNYLSDIRPKYYFNECEIKNEFPTMPSIKDENSDSQPLLSVPYSGSEANGQEHLTDIEELASEGDASPSVSPSPMKPHLVKKGSDDEKSTDDESVEGSGDELETERTVPVIDIETFLPGNSQEVLSFTEGYAREPSPMLSDFEGDKVNIDNRHSRNVKRAVNKALSLGSEEVSQDLTDEENMTDSAPNDTDDNNSEIFDSSLPDYYLHGGDSISNHEIVKSVSPVSKLEFGTKKSRHGKPKECLLVQEEPEGNTDVEDLSTESQKIVKTLKTKRKKPKSKTKRNKNIPSVGSTLVPTPNEEEGVTDTEMLDGSNASSTSSEDSEDFNEDVVIPAEDLGELTDTENMHTSDMEDEDLIPCPVEKSDVPPMPEPLNENIKISETGDKDDEDPQEGMNEGEGRNSGKRRRAHNEEAKEPQSDSGEGEDADTDLDDVNIEDKDDEDIINDMIQRIPKEDTNILLEMDGGSDFVSNSKSENPQAEEEPRESTLTLGNTPEAVTDVEEWDDKGGVTKVKRKSPKCKAKYASDTDTDNTEESDLDDSKPSYRKKPQKGAKGTRRLPLVQQVSDVKLVATDRGLLSIVITPDDTSTNAVEDVPSEEKELVILEEDEWDKSITETVEAPQSAVLATDEDQEPVTDTEDFEDTEFLGINRPDTPLPPDTSTLPSPKREKIHIVEDEYGVPHVKIENLDDDEADIAEEAEQTLTDDENVEFDEDEASNLIVNIDSDGEASSILMGLDSIEVSTKTKNKKNRRAALNPIDPEDGHTDIEEISPLRKAKRRPKTKRTTLGVNDEEGEGEEGHTDIENLDDPQENDIPVVTVDGEESSGTDYEHFETSGGEESEAPPPCAPTPEVIRKSAVKRTVVYRENPGGTFRTEIQEENPTGRFLALGDEPSGATDVEDVEISEGEEASEDSFRKSGASPNLPDIDDSKVSVSVKPVHHHPEEAEEESQIKENLLLPEPHGTHTDVESLDEGEETEVLTTAVSRSTTSTEAPPESTLKEADLAVLDSIVATQEAEVEEMVFTESDSTKRNSSAIEEDASSSSKTEAGKRVPPPIPPRKILPEPLGGGAPESLLLEKVKKASGELEPQQSSSDEGDEQLALMKDSPRWEEEEIQNEEPSDERPIKAEIKLLVKTTEVGKESIEIRSIREFVDKNAGEKEGKSDPPQPPEATNTTTTTPTTQSTTTTTTTDDKKPSTRQKTSTKGKGRGKSNPRFVRASEGGGASHEQGNNDDFNLMAQVRDLISVDDKEKELGSHSADFEESSKSEMKQKEKKTKPTT